MAPRRDQRHRHDIAAIDRRRSAGDEQQVATGGLAQRGGERGGIMIAGRGFGERAAQRRDACARHLCSLGEQLVRNPGQASLYQCRGEGVEGIDADRPGGRDGGGEGGRRHRIGDDLDRRDDVAGLDAAAAPHDGEGEVFGNSVDRGDHRRIDGAKPGGGGGKVDAAVRRGQRRHARARQCRAQRNRCRVFGDITGFEPGNRQSGDALGAGGGDVGGADNAALGPACRTDAARMRQDAAGRRVDGDGGEDHAAAAVTGLAGCRDRHAAVSSAAMLRAISAGSAAPMARPAGPCSRASAAASKPSAARRSQRRA